MGLLYQKRRLKVRKIKRQVMANRAKLTRLRVLLSLILMILACFCSKKVLKMSQWYIDMDKLSHADSSVLTIQGNNITPDYKIINIIRQTQLPNVQIFRLNTKELEENIMQLQTVKKVFIRRYWFPARLNIALDERTPVFLISPNLESEPNSALTTDGILIDHEYFPFKNPVKAKKLLTYGVRNGLDEVWDKKKVDELIKLTKVIEMYSNQEVQYIDIRDKSDVYIMLKDYLVRFGEINDTAQARAKCIASILPQAEKYGKKTKYIDLRWDDSRYIRLEGAKEEKEENQQNSNTVKEEENTKQPQEEEKRIEVEVQEENAN